MHGRMNRKSFLKTAGLASAALVASTLIASVARETEKAVSVAPVKVIRVRPLAGKNYSPSFARLSQRVKFASVQDAVRRVRGQRTPYMVCAVG